MRFRENFSKEFFVALDGFPRAGPQSRATDAHAPTCWEYLSRDDTHVLALKRQIWEVKGNDPEAKSKCL